jgi:Fe-S oxidoreductase
MSSLESRKNYLSSCSRCSSCKWVPVVKSERFAHICPSVVHGRFHAYSASGMLINGYSLLNGTVGYDNTLNDSIFSCSMCGGCDVACKTNFADLVEPLDSLYALREKIVSEDQQPQALKTVAKHLRDLGNPLGVPPAQRGRWMEGTGLGHAGSGPASVLLHVGDDAFDESRWPQLHHVVDLLRQQGLSVVAGGMQEPDCGALAFDIGERQLAETLARKTVAWIEASGAKHLITCSDAAFSAFRNIYPRLGVALDGVRIQHISEWLAEHPSPPVGEQAEAVVTYHDSCKLGRLSEPYQPWTGEWVTQLNSLPTRTQSPTTRFGVGGVYDAPRQALAAAGAKVVEMERIREASFCCGAAGGAELSQPGFADTAGRHRLEEALATGANTLVTSCSQCSRHLGRIASEDRLALRVVTLVDYLRERSTTAQPTAIGVSA